MYQWQKKAEDILSQRKKLFFSRLNYAFGIVCVLIFVVFVFLLVERNRKEVERKKIEAELVEIAKMNAPTTTDFEYEPFIFVAPVQDSFIRSSNDFDISKIPNLRIVDENEKIYESSN